MSQRAAGNGYSWWWASNIRTKQSKWLEQNLQDMEDKVEHVLNLIQKDGDSFAKRAEMYYKHRPDVISFVEETVRAYRSLAQRYDKLSTELQKANTTIASICPEKVSYEDDDDYTVGPSKILKNDRENTTKIPKAPKLPGKKNSSKKTIKAKDDQDNVETLMNESVLKSCDESLRMLQEKLESVKHKFDLDQVNDDKSKSNDDQKETEMVAEMAETIDKIVNKIVSLETSVSSQTQLTDSLRQETDDLQAQIQKLEAQKAELMKLQKTSVLETESRKHDISWQQMLLNGLEDKDDILLEEYISILKSYKKTKKQLSEEEQRNQGTLSLMKSAIVKRNYKIQLLEQKLKRLQQTSDEDELDVLLAENKDDEFDMVDESQTVSTVERKLRMEIDKIFDENLGFWLRFSNAFRQVLKFKNQVKELQEEVNKIKVRGLEGKSSTSMFTTDLITEIKPVYKHLKEINGKLTIWLEESKSLRNELQMRCSYLTKIEEKITQALTEGVEDEEIKFSTHEAEKFKGEISNIKQENNKVEKELQACLDHVIALKLDVEKTLERLEMEFRLVTKQNPLRKGRSMGRSTTLRSLIFGSKSKKQNSCFFTCIGGHHKKGKSF